MKLPSDKEALVLSLLAGGESLYGLQLVERSDGRLRRGTVYVTLGRMQDKGLIRAMTDRDPSGHAGMPRPRYCITAAGSRALQAHAAVGALLRPQRGRA